MTQIDSPLIVALDYNNADDALRMADQLNPNQCRVKIGKELFTHTGKPLISQLHSRGFEVFLDLKFHDIPNTTAQAVLAAAEMGVWMVNVHATGGRVMMHTCAERLALHKSPTLLIGVTVLTSMQQQDLAEIGIQSTPKDHALRLAGLAQQSGLHGVVCSAHESEAMRQQFGNDFLLVTPGIRPTGSGSDDQKRIMTPSEALTAGSDYLVIGRPITAASKPDKALAKILIECGID